MPRGPRPDDMERADGCIAFGILAIVIIMAALVFSPPFLVILVRR